MKNILILIALLLVGCGSKSIKNDQVSTSDYQSYYESVFTSVGEEFNFGSAVYQFNNTDGFLRVYTVLDGNYEVKSNSCNFDLVGTYTDSEILDIPLSDMFEGDKEKLCMITIQINPVVKESQHVVSPRYSIIYAQFTNRQFVSKSYQFPSEFDAGSLFSLKSLPKYRLIQNCVDKEPVIVKESMVGGDLEINFSDLKQTSLGSCFYSLVYTENSIPKRLAFSINVYKNSHQLLTAKYTIKKRKIEVESDPSVSICAVDQKAKYSNVCKGEYRKGVIIQVHTNKRSYYKVVEE